MFRFLILFVDFYLFNLYPNIEISIFIYNNF